MSCLTCIIQNPCRPAPSSPSEDNKTAFLRDSGFEFRINTQETGVTPKHVVTPRGLSTASCQAPPLLVGLGLISSLLENGRRSQVRLDLRNGERCMLACSSESETGLDPLHQPPAGGGGREGRGRRHIWEAVGAGAGFHLRLARVTYVNPGADLKPSDPHILCQGLGHASSGHTDAVAPSRCRKQPAVIFETPGGKTTQQDDTDAA